MKHLYLPAFLIIALLISGCVMKHADLAIVGSKKIAMDLQGFEKVGEATGESVSHGVIIFTLKEASLEEAIQDALQKTGGDIMTDAVVYHRFWTVPLIYSQFIVQVKGNVWKLKKEENQHSDKL